MNTDTLHQNGRWHTPFLPCWKPEDGPHPRKRPRALCFEALLALMMLLMLACTAVQDPSGRWKTSGMDPELEGKWVEKRAERVPEEHLFTKQKGGYYLTPFKDKQDKDALAARTFTAGKKHFMVMVASEAAKNGFDKVPKEKRSGIVWMYKIEDDTLRIHMLNNDVLTQAIRDGKIKGILVPKPKKSGEGTEPLIATLDDATCAALAELTKDENAWKEIGQFKRVKDEVPAKKTDENPAEKPATK